MFEQKEHHISDQNLNHTENLQSRPPGSDIYNEKVNAITASIKGDL